jgi:hypothetical protein
MEPADLQDDRQPAERGGGQRRHDERLESPAERE